MGKGEGKKIKFYFEFNLSLFVVVLSAAMLKPGLCLALLICYLFYAHLPKLHFFHKFVGVSCGKYGNILGISNANGVDTFFGCVSLSHLV